MRRRRSDWLERPKARVAAVPAPVLRDHHGRPGRTGGGKGGCAARPSFAGIVHLAGDTQPNTIDRAELGYLVRWGKRMTLRRGRRG